MASISIHFPPLGERTQKKNRNGVSCSDPLFLYSRNWSFRARNAGSFPHVTRYYYLFMIEKWNLIFVLHRRPPGLELHTANSTAHLQRTAEPRRPGLCICSLWISLSTMTPVSRWSGRRDPQFASDHRGFQRMPAISSIICMHRKRLTPFRKTKTA